jgi:hypothetical protein
MVLGRPFCPLQFVQTSSSAPPPLTPLLFRNGATVCFAVITSPARVFSGFFGDNKHKRDVFGGSLTGTPYIVTRHASAAERKTVELRRSLRDAKVEICAVIRCGYTCDKRRCTRVCLSVAKKKYTCLNFFSSFVIAMGYSVPSGAKSSYRCLRWTLQRPTLQITSVDLSIMNFSNSWRGYWVKL